MLVAGALAALAIVAVGVVLFVLLGARGTGPSGGSGGSGGSGAVVEQGGAADFAWLETAMKQCDAEAAKDTKALIFLVTPLDDEPRDETGWRRIAINDFGNGILINSEDTLAGLRRKALRVSKTAYSFRVRNEETREVLAWKPTVGVRKFVNNDASGIQSFRAQFESSDPARALQWGAIIKREPGNCYWVNAILRQ
jgi:hypothetical protein